MPSSHFVAEQGDRDGLLSLARRGMAHRVDATERSRYSSAGREASCRGTSKRLEAEPVGDAPSEQRLLDLSNNEALRSSSQNG